MEFEAPLVTGLTLPAQQRRVVFPEDVIQFSPSVPHSLQLGDKVLAPWEPEQQRYGPGTVLVGLKKQKGQTGKKAAMTLGEVCHGGKEHCWWSELRGRRTTAKRTLPCTIPGGLIHSAVAAEPVLSSRLYDMFSIGQDRPWHGGLCL